MLRFFFTTQQWIYGFVFSPETYLKWTGTNTLTLIGCLLAIIVVAYFLGSVNSAIILTRIVYGEDIRQKGSGNAGMTNVMRSYGWLPALITLIGDMLKCMLSMFLGTILWGINGAYIAGLFCIIGHVAPAIYKFKGGKGVAATFMFILYIDIWAFVFIGITFILLVWATRYLSLGSIITGMIMPLMLDRMLMKYTELEVNNLRFLRLTVALLIGALVVYKHRANIIRIRDKTESRFTFKRTVKRADLDESKALATETADHSETAELTEEDLKRKAENRKKSAKKKK